MRTRRGRAAVAGTLLLAIGLPTLLYAVYHNRTPRSFYVALGDSYTSGPGIPVQIDTQTGCERSSRSYPVLVARRLNLNARRFRDASCSGAEIANLTGPQKTGGATDRPQLAALTTGTTLVTLGIGGNDVGWSDILTRCVELDLPGVLIAAVFRSDDRTAPCRAAFTADGRDQIRQRIEAASARLSTALALIRRRVPHARVLVVGYPDLLPAAGGDACTRVLGITPGDIAYLNSEELRLNSMLNKEATAAGDGYVNTYAPSIGHDACASPATRWIEPLLPGAPAAPMHPNALGEHGIADAVERAITTDG